MNNYNNAVIKAVVLAAGKGTRMKSDLAKVLHPLAGKSLLGHVLETIAEAGIGRTVVVVGHQAADVEASCTGPGLDFVVQEPQLGTGHAVQMAVPVLDTCGFCVVLAGDVPLLRAETLRRLVRETLDKKAAAVVLTCVVPDAGAYGRIVKDETGRVQKIVEAKDASSEELAIGEYNSGVFCFQTDLMIEALSNLTTDNVQGEYYLTDTVAWLVEQGYPVLATSTDDPGEVAGINTVDELAGAEQYLKCREA
ncbi:MAG: NTP transferase domain-containing protein [Gemmatimonadales bacterium]|nr:NTP transferase domain-containing protein [Gemmatimonadales bacterium]